MPAIIIPDKWKSAPFGLQGLQVDWSSQLANKLVAVFDTVSGIEVVSGTQLGIRRTKVTRPYEGNGPSKYTGQDTRGFGGSATLGEGLSNNDCISTAFYNSSKERTVLTTTLLTGAALYPRIYTSVDSVGDQESLFYDDQVYFKMAFKRRFSGSIGTWNVSLDDPLVNASLIQHFGVAYSSASVPVFYCNGTLHIAAEISTPTGSVIIEPALMTIGNVAPGDLFGAWQGTIGPVYVWDRVLTTEEVQAHYVEPMQLFKPRSRVLFFLATSTTPILSEATATSITTVSATPRVNVSFTV